jgi:predicted NBD/HSP70 family sugar kinase
VAAGPALVELLRRSYGDAFTAADMLAASAAGDLGCRRVLGDGGRAIGRALADLVNVLNPSLIVVGGELSAAGEPLLDGIHESIRLHALPAAAEAASITAGTLGERAALLGALALVISHTPHPSVPASTTKQEGLL